MKEIIEDTISRNQKFQKERSLRVKRMKELNAPAGLIEYEEMIAKMNLAEYDVHLIELDNAHKAMIAEYAKNNPIQKHIVDEIYDRIEKVEYKHHVYSYNVWFLMAINPLDFMSKEDFDNDLYQTFLDHAKEIYRKKYLNEFTEEEAKYWS